MKPNTTTTQPAQCSPLRACIALTSVMCFVLLTFFFQLSPAVLSGQFVQSFHRSSTLLENSASLFFLSYFIMQIPAGLLLDRLKPKWVILTALLIAAFSCFWFTQSHGLSEFIISRMILGGCCAFSYVGVLFLAVNLFPLRWYGLLIGITELICASGAMLAQTPLQWLSEHVLWRHSFLFVALILLALTLIAGLTIPNSVSRSNKPRKKLQPMLALAASKLRSTQLLSICFYTGLLWLPMIGLGGFFAMRYFHQMRGFSMAHASLLCLAMWAAMGLATPILGLLTEHIQRRQRIMLILATLGFFASLILAIPPLFGYTTLLLAMIGIGIACAGAPFAFTIANDHARPSIAGTVIGATNTSIVIGGWLGQLLISGVLSFSHLVMPHPQKTFEQWHVALGLIPLSYLIGIGLCVFVIRETYCQPQYAPHRTKRQ